MPTTGEPFGWAKGLGGTAIRLGAALAAVLALLVLALVWATKDTPPVNAAVHHTEGSGMDALLEARLVMSPGCITVDVGGQSWTPVFPSDSVRLEHDALLYDGAPYRTGDLILLPGGEVSAPPADARIPADCPGRYWLVAP